MYRNKSVEEFYRTLTTGKTLDSVDDLNHAGVELAVVGGEEGKQSCDLDEGGLYKAIVPENAPVCLTWSNLTIKTKPKNGISKTLINNISGTISGGLWGIMGASGSGKTTFLSALSIRLDTNRMDQSGEIHMNGKDYSKAVLKGMSGYVMQDDLLAATLTVGETLGYTAALRMGLKFSRAERDARCAEVLELMGISYCRDVIVGDSRNKGISGGERKRLCVAMELLTKPKLLFLDEPTSGLDSSTALAVMTSLKALADAGECTVVCTIHQPQTKIYNILDNLILMKKAAIVYQGAANCAEKYFASYGYPCPDRCNPADHLLDIVTMGTHGEKEQEQANINMLTPPLNMDFGLEKDDFTLRAINPWLFQFFILSKRCLHEKFRRWDIFATNIFITCLVGTFVGMGSWYQIGNAQDTVRMRTAICFFSVIHQGVVASLQGTYSFPLERALMLRERAAGSYYVSAYFFSKSTVEAVLQFANPFLYTAFTIPMTGFQATPDKFCKFLAFNMLMSLCATSLANLMCCISVSIEMSTVVLACCMELTRLYSAFFVSPVQLDALSGGKWKFVDAVSYMKYGFVGLSLTEFEGNTFSPCTTVGCPKKVALTPAEGPSAACTAWTTGEQYINCMGYQQYNIEYCAGMMCVYIVIARFFAYLALRFIKT